MHREWGDLWIHLLETPTRDKNLTQTIYGSPYIIDFLFEIYSHSPIPKYSSAEILSLRIECNNTSEEIFNIMNSDNKIQIDNRDNDFEKIGEDIYASLIVGYPLHLLYENQFLIVRFKLTSDETVIEEVIKVELKVKKRKWLGLHIWEMGKHV